MPALWMTASIRPILLTWSASERVCSALARSPMATPAARGESSARAAARSFERACSTTWCPSFINVSAAPRPRPSVEPVMNTRIERTFAPADRERAEFTDRAPATHARCRSVLRRDLEWAMHFHRGLAAGGASFGATTCSVCQPAARVPGLTFLDLVFGRDTRHHFDVDAIRKAGLDLPLLELLRRRL